MRRIFALLSIGICLLLTRCGPKEISHDEVVRLLEEGKAYPRTIDHRIYCGHTDDAKQMVGKGLVAAGLVVAKETHTATDIGKPLISFTEKASPYLVPTSDTLKAIDVQRVKIADEKFGEITSIRMSAGGERAVVEYTTTVENQTPFAVLLKDEPKEKQIQRTSFTLSGKGWTWDGKIVEARGQ